ncbi:hypothetical protein B0J15DRAFT_571736 [Fusarium solani]|uniref:Uncharacterized protein n=1 Tax=Fusarium solani TaxID=169388 RepID=A0A9P9G8S7_FUSSL|nr:uncharacterized protein B0J15DRAFT_571736 [Fusarium solani]KAH7234110.1 hypothetical protein B0J15DRAFT_571736 [Fusarium solani]
MSDKKQSITLRETNTTYPGPGANFQTNSWTQGKSNPPQSITLRPTRVDPPPNWAIPPRTQNIPLICINGIPLSDLPADTPAGKVWIPEEDEEGVEFTRPVVHGTIKFRPDPPPFPGSSPASELSTGTTQDTPTSTGTLWPRVPPGFTEAHRGQANLYDRPLHLIPSEYSHYGAQNYHQLDAGRIAGPVIAGPVTPRSDRTPTDVYSSASSYLSRNNMLSPIRTTGLNPVANNFTPGASPMVSTTDKETPRAPAAFSRLGQSGPLSPELARDKIYLDNQAQIQWRNMFRPAWVGQPRAQVRENQETKDLAGQDSHEGRQVIEDERERIDAVNDWFWAQATQAPPAPKPEPKK